VTAAGTVSASEATTIYCPKCGQIMLVAAEHLHIAVSCPACQKKIKPWRVIEAARRETASVSPASSSPPPITRPDGYSTRNRWIAGALAILLGPFGVHRFYMGFIGVGVVQALITIISIGTLAPLVALWAFIEGILCFCGTMHDVDGRPLSG